MWEPHLSNLTVMLQAEINTLNYCPLKEITSDRGNGKAAEIKKGFKAGRSGGGKVAPGFWYFQTAVLKCVLLVHNWKFKISLLILPCFDDCQLQGTQFLDGKQKRVIISVSCSGTGCH